MSFDAKLESELTPRKIVEALDQYIIGQTEAKRSVAIALRNRYRRRHLPEDLKFPAWVSADPLGSIQGI